MKCQSKIEASVSNPLGGVDHILIMGKMYECELTPKIYNPYLKQKTKKESTVNLDCSSQL